MSDTITSPANQGKSLKLALMLTWIILGAIIAYLAWERYAPTAQSNAKPLETIVQTQTSQAQVLDSIQKTLDLYQQQFQQIADHDVKIVGSLKQLDNAISSGSGTWGLMQIQRYIEQAVVQADLMNNPDAAIQFLNMADMQVQRMNNPNFLPLREAIAKDKQMLTAGVTLTRENVILALNAAIDTLPNIKQRTELLAPVTPASAPANAPPETWKDHILRSLAELKALIVVRHHDDTIPSYFSPNEAEIVTENMQLMLLQAAYAASLGNQNLFQNHLSMAIAWLNRYYDINSPIGAKLLATLTNLKGQTIAPQKIVQFASIDAWKQIVQSKKPAPAVAPVLGSAQ